jgi:hypothetical protein
MRGFVVPKKPDDYWECARIVLNGEFTHTTSQEATIIFLEWLLLGPDRSVQLHLLVPTQFGILLNKKRAERVVSVAKENPDKASILLQQHDCMVRCVKCNKELKQHEDKPYQVVIRMATGQTLDDSNVWNYDFLLCFFCFDCQTTKTCALLKTSEVMYESLSECIAKYGFSQEFTHTSDLMDVYLERFILLNQYTPEILRESMQTHKYCYHCGKQVKKIRPCAKCDMVSFCVRGDCLEKATSNNHEQHLCVALRERHLFHVEEALYVYSNELIGKKEVLPCKRYAKIC